MGGVRPWGLLVGLTPGRKGGFSKALPLRTVGWKKITAHTFFLRRLGPWKIMGYTGGCRRPVNFPFGAINLMDCKTAHYFLSPSLGGAGRAVRLTQNMPENALPGVQYCLLRLLVKIFPGDRGWVYLFPASCLVQGRAHSRCFREPCRAGCYLIGTFPECYKGWGSWW